MKKGFMMYVHFVNKSSLLACFAFFILAGLPVTIHAQWADDPAANTVLVDKSGEQTQPKFVPHPEGGGYLSWFDNETGGYNVFIQRLDADGNKLWDPNGVLVADRGFSSTQDYGLSIDTEGYALLAFRDDRFGSERITVNRISPDGELDWGTDGVQLTDGSGFVASPVITGASDGNIVAAWTGDGPAGVASLDSSGNINWNTTIGADTGLAISDVRASDSPGESGEVILVSFSFGGVPPVAQQLRTQKLDADGNTLWGDDWLEIFSEGSLQFGNFPKMLPDGSGGMLITWYQSQPALQSYIQSVSHDGEFLFEDGGLPVSTSTAQLRVNPSAAHDASTGDFYIFWRELDSTQSQQGIYGQRVNQDGDRLWGDTGKVIRPLLGSNEFGSILASRIDGDVVLSFSENVGSGQHHIFAARYDSDGNPAWDGEFVDVSTRATTKSRLLTAETSSHENVLIWADGSTGNTDIYGQNLNSDGSLGPFDAPEGEWVAFQVDMSVQAGSGLFDPGAGDKVYTRGSFNDFAADADSEMIGEDFLYSVSIQIEGDAGTEHEYKFFVETGDGREYPNDGWEGEVGPGENGNRTLTLAGEDQILDPVLFNNEAIGAFSLLTPEDGTTLTSHPDEQDQTVTYSWDEAAVKGSPVYTVVFIEEGGDFSEPLGIFEAGDSGAAAMVEISFQWINDLFPDQEEIQKTLNWKVIAMYEGEERTSAEVFTVDYCICVTNSTGDDENLLPSEVALHQNYPNPFNPTTNITFDLPEISDVRLEIYNITGQRVAVLADGRQAAGTHRVSFDGSALSSGIYIYRLQVNEVHYTRKMMLIK